MSDLPPLEQPQAYVVVGPNDQRGPYTLELLIGEVVAGRLADTTPVWWPGLADWTTMGAHPAVAAEVARRRSQPAAGAGYAAPQADQYAAPQADQYAAPQADQYAAPQADQYAAPQADQYAAPQAVAEPAPAPVVDAEHAAAVPSVAELTAESTATSGEASSRVAQVPDEDRANFERVVERSRSRSEETERIAALDSAFLDAVGRGAVGKGLTETDRSTGDTQHELRFEGGPGETVAITVGRIGGVGAAEVRDEDVPLTLRVQSVSYGGALDAGTGAHGEVLVISDEWSGQATATVRLLVPVGDYADADLAVDDASLARDVGAAVAVVRARML